MNDMRLSLDFVDHPKVRKLIRKAGYEGFYSLIKLFSMAGKLYQKGVLKDLEIEDIEDLCEWHGEEGKLVETLIDVCFIDKTQNCFIIHDWRHHQPWIYHADARSEQAKKAIEARWEKAKNRKEDTKNTDSIRPVIREYTNSDTDRNTPLPLPLPLPSPIPKKRKDTLAQTSFARFWELYPKKKAKGDAEKAWKKLKPSESLVDTIIKAVEAQKSSTDWKRDGGQYIPYPATWLNRKGWEDEVESSPTVSTGTERPQMPTKCDKCGKPLDNDGKCVECNRIRYYFNGTYGFDDLVDPQLLQDFLRSR